MDNRGYSTRVVEANAQASDSLGVLLGKYCISRDIPATEVAGYFGVSRMTIYNWFSGKKAPAPRYAAKISMLLRTGGWNNSDNN